MVIGNPAGGNKYDPEGELNDIEEVLDNLEDDLDNNGRPDSFSEYNFSIQQAVRSSKVGGKICLVLPESFFANSTDELLRKYLIKYCKIYAIVSLPRGVFRKGTTTRTVSSGSASSSQKMSILFAVKNREVEEGSGIDDDLEQKNYSIFLASIKKPDDVDISIDDWLDPLLERTLKEWINWTKRQNLLEDNDKVELPTKKKVTVSTTIQESLIKPVEPLFEAKEVNLPTLKKKTIIPKSLKKIFIK